MTTARSISIGFRLSTTTTITVTLPSSDPSATAHYFVGNNKPCVSIPRDGTQFQVELPSGDYALIVDSTIRPGTTSVFTVGFSSSVLLWSTQHPDLGALKRPWETATGSLVSVNDPKDPWPTLASSTAGAAAFGSTSLSGTMDDLLNANAGRSGVEEDDDASAAAS